MYIASKAKKLVRTSFFFQQYPHFTSTNLYVTIFFIFSEFPSVAFLAEQYKKNLLEIYCLIFDVILRILLQVQFLRARGLSLLLSCPLLSPRPRDKERCAAHVVHHTIVDLIRLWLVRLLRFLFTMCALTLIALRNHARVHAPRNVPGTCSSIPAPSGSINLVGTDHCTQIPSVLTQRVSRLCDAFKSPVRVNNPIAGGGFFLVRHADWVSRVAISFGVSGSDELLSNKLDFVTK